MSTEPTHPTIVALKDLIGSEGWKLFVEHLDKEYGPRGYGVKMQHALSAIPTGSERAYELARVAEQIDGMARAINELILWPEQEIRRLSPDPLSRRPFAALRRTGG